MEKKILIFLFIGILIVPFLVSNTEVYASSAPGEKITVVTPVKIKTLDKMIKISEPNFDVTINGIIVNDINAVHKIICYNNIVYFPLDWIYSNWLGFDISMSENDEIIIDNTGEVNSFVSWGKQLADGVVDNLGIREIDGIISNEVIINGKVIDNTNEIYPLLKYFGGEVYFPLTWKWVVNEFGWSYVWDAQTGLTIHTKKDINTSDILLQTQILSEINELTYKKSAYVNAVVKSLETNESYYINLKKETLGIQEGLNRANFQLITDSYTNCYFESQPIADENSRNTIADENSRNTIDDKKNRNTIVVEGRDGVKYGVDGYRYRYTLEHEYKEKVSDISVNGKSYLDDIHIIAYKVENKGILSQENNIYQFLRNAGYIHEETPEYNLCDNLLKFEFLSGRNKVISFEKTMLYGSDEVYKIEYETNDRNYLNLKVNTWDENTYINQPKISTKKTAFVILKKGDISQIIINDGKFEYDMSITIYSR